MWFAPPLMVHTWSPLLCRTKAKNMKWTKFLIMSSSIGNFYCYCGGCVRSLEKHSHHHIINAATNKQRKELLLLLSFHKKKRAAFSISPPKPFVWCSCNYGLIIGFCCSHSQSIWNSLFQNHILFFKVKR